MAKETVTYELKVDADVKTLKQMADAVEDIKKEMEDIPVGSKRFNDLKKELISVESELKNVELGLESLDTEQVTGQVSAFGGAIGDLTGGLVLLAGESETMQQVANNVERALGITMLFRGVSEGFVSARKLYNQVMSKGNFLLKANNMVTKAAAFITKMFGFSVNATSKAFKGLKAAIIATGIGALVVLIGTLVEYFMSLGDEIDDDTSSMNKFNAELDNANQRMKETLEMGKRIDKSRNNTMKMMRSNLDLELAKMKQNGASEDKINKKKLEFRVAEDASLKASINLRKGELKAADDVLLAAKMANIEYEQQYNSQLDSYNQLLNIGETLEDNEQSHYDTLVALREQTKSNLENAHNQKRATEQQIVDLQLEQDLIKNKRDIEDINFSIQKRISREKKKQVKEAERLLELAEKQKKVDEFGELLTLEQDYLEQSRQAKQTDLEKSLEEEDLKYFELKNKAIAFNESLLEDEQNMKISLEEIEMVHKENMQFIQDNANEEFIEGQNDLLANQLDYYQQVEDAEHQLMMAKVGMARAGLNVLMTLADEESKLATAMFIIDKALAIGEVFLNLQREIAGISASYSVIPGGAAIAAPLIVAAKIRAGISTAAIVASTLTKFKSGAASQEGAGAGGGGGNPQPPPNLGPTNQSTLIEQDADGNVVQVYVSETDITNTQNGIQTIVQQATFN